MYVFMYVCMYVHTYTHKLIRKYKRPQKHTQLACIYVRALIRSLFTVCPATGTGGSRYVNKTIVALFAVLQRTVIPKLKLIAGFTRFWAQTIYLLTRSTDLVG